MLSKKINGEIVKYRYVKIEDKEYIEYRIKGHKPCFIPKIYLNIFEEDWLDNIVYEQITNGSTLWNIQ